MTKQNKKKHLKRRQIEMNQKEKIRNMKIKQNRRNTWGTKQSYCCDRKSRAACVQSFARWQQAKIEIT